LNVGLISIWTYDIHNIIKVNIVNIDMYFCNQEKNNLAKKIMLYELVLNVNINLVG
jgi:hypothetical protein